MNVKLGICNFCIPGEGIFGPQIVKEFGLDGMSLEFGSFEHGWPLGQRKIQELYLEAQQRYGIAYPNIGVSDGDHVPFHARKGTRWEGVMEEAGKRAVDAAVYMEIPLVFFSNFNASLCRTKEDVQITAEVYRRICDYAGEYGVEIGCENPNSIACQEALYEQVDRGNFHLFFDSCNHACLTDYDIHEVLKALYPKYTDQMHVKDGIKGKNASCILGTGESGFFQTIALLKEFDYEGWLILENLYELEAMRHLNPDYFEIMRADVQALKAAVKQ